MANETTFQSDFSSKTLEIEFAGRRFPALQDSPTMPPMPVEQGRIRQLRTQDTDDALPQLLATTIWKRLVWQDLRTKADSGREAIVSAYIGSLQQLEGFCEEFRQVVRAACLANLEFRQGAGQTNAEARDEVVERQLSEMVALASDGWLPTKNIASAELLSKSAEVYRQRLDVALSDAAEDFAKQCFDLLGRLVDREVCGLVEWLPNHCCQYHFFRRVVIQGAENLTQTTQGIYAGDSFNMDLGASRQVTSHGRTITDRRVRHQIRFARHEHEVINAIRTSTGNSRVVMPPQVTQLINTIPDWLSPFVQVIDGEIVRERIIERDVAVEDWRRVTVEDWTQVVVRDRPIFGWEPGVIIGPYVLCGWGPREIEREQERRRVATEAQEKESSGRIAYCRAVLLSAAAVLFTGVAIWAFFFGPTGASGMGLAILAAATAVGLIWQAVLDFASCDRDLF